MQYIKDIVDKMVKKYKTSSPYELCDFLNIIVVITRLPQNIRGFCQQLYGKNVIYINSELDDEQQKIVCAHELGHVVLHQGCNYFLLASATHYCMSKYERQADCFCTHLTLSGYDIDELSEYTWEEIGRLTGLNERVVE